MSNSGVILIFATDRLLHSWTLYCNGYKTATPLTIQLLSYCTLFPIIWHQKITHWKKKRNSKQHVSPEVIWKKNLKLLQETEVLLWEGSWPAMDCRLMDTCCHLEPPIPVSIYPYRATTVLVQALYHFYPWRFFENLIERLVHWLCSEWVQTWYKPVVQISTFHVMTREHLCSSYINSRHDKRNSTSRRTATWLPSSHFFQARQWTAVL